MARRLPQLVTDQDIHATDEEIGFLETIVSRRNAREERRIEALYRASASRDSESTLRALGARGLGAIGLLAASRDRAAPASWLLCPSIIASAVLVEILFSPPGLIEWIVAPALVWLVAAACHVGLGVPLTQERRTLALMQVMIGVPTMFDPGFEPGLFDVVMGLTLMIGVVTGTVVLELLTAETGGRSDSCDAGREGTPPSVR